MPRISSLASVLSAAKTTEPHQEAQHDRHVLLVALAPPHPDFGFSWPERVARTNLARAVPTLSMLSLSMLSLSMLSRESLRPTALFPFLWQGPDSATAVHALALLSQAAAKSEHHIPSSSAPALKTCTLARESSSVKNDAEGKKKDPNVVIPVEGRAGKRGGGGGGGGGVAPRTPAGNMDSAAGHTAMHHGKENSEDDEDDLPEMLTSRSGTRSEDSNESPPRVSPLDVASSAGSSAPGPSLLSALTKRSGGLMMSEWCEWSEGTVGVIDCTASKEVEVHAHTLRESLFDSSAS
jgi:hypothetical protein